MPFIESFDEFKLRQKSPFITLKNGSTIFENGASCVCDAMFGSERLVSFREPPVERFELLRAKRVYYQSLFNAEKDAYAHAHNEYATAAKYAVLYPDACPALDPRCMDSLAAGQQRLDDLTEKLKELDAELAESPEAIARRNHYEQQAEKYRRREQQQHQLAAVASGQPLPKAPRVPVPDPLDTLAKLMRR